MTHVSVRPHDMSVYLPFYVLEFGSAAFKRTLYHRERQWVDLCAQGRRRSTCAEVASGSEVFEMVLPSCLPTWAYSDDYPWVFCGVEFKPIRSDVETVRGITVERVVEAVVGRIVISDKPLFPMLFGEEYELPPDGMDVVYYLEVPGPLVKVGTTSHLKRRLREHRANSAVVRLLAWHPGGRQAEASVHAKLRGSRCQDVRESFYPSPDVLEHLSNVAAPLTTGDVRRRSDLVKAVALQMAAR